MLGVFTQADALGHTPKQIVEALPSAQPDLSEYSDKLWKNAYERGKAEAEADKDELLKILKMAKFEYEEAWRIITHPTPDVTYADKNRAQVILDTFRDSLGKIIDELSTVQPDHNADSDKKVKGDCIRRQAAVELAMKYCPDDDGAVQCDGDIRGLLDELENLLTAQPETHWIPCSERLPEDGRYLVTRFDFVTNTCFLDILWYEKGVWWNRLYTGDFAVIAWMPLPEPYKGGDSE